MKLTIWGAAQQVTGSMHLLQTDNYNILIDCGLDYEKGTYQEENEFFPFDPSSIDVVILTHAHIDHSGNLPTLVRLGFAGQILCTPPTADLTEILLFDSVNIFLSKQKKKPKRGRGNYGPLHVIKTLYGVNAAWQHRTGAGQQHAGQHRAPVERIRRWPRLPGDGSDQQRGCRLGQPVQPAPVAVQVGADDGQHAHHQDQPIARAQLHRAFHSSARRSGRPAMRSSTGYCRPPW